DAIPKRVAPPEPKHPVEAPEAGEQVLRGAARAIAKNMDASLSIPTATTVRDMPAKLMFENRAIINQQLLARGSGKISFTHIIGWALVRAVQAHPDMNLNYKVVDNKPTVVTPEHINLGLAIDMNNKDGSRSLVVAAITETETMNFSEVLVAYRDLVPRPRLGKRPVRASQGVPPPVPSPGGTGTRHSVPRLTNGQGAIIGVGAMDYPAEFQGTSVDRL